MLKGLARYDHIECIVFQFFPMVWLLRDKIHIRPMLHIKSCIGKAIVRKNMFVGSINVITADIKN